KASKDKMNHVWLALDSGMSWLPSPSKKERPVKTLTGFFHAREYLPLLIDCFLHRGLWIRVSLSTPAVVSLRLTGSTVERWTYEIFMLKLAYYGAPFRPLNNLAAGGRLPAAGCRDKDSGVQFHIALTSHATGAD
ncbi:hypothetical protein FOFC_20911, partial [Fusarium oxysporum]